jgi:hypothetical protein
MDTLFRIYTEDINRDAVLAITGQTFDAFTCIPSNGVWQGTSEASLILEIAGKDSDAIAVRGLAQHIKAMNHQDAVLITRTPFEGVLV